MRFIYPIIFATCLAVFLACGSEHTEVPDQAQEVDLTREDEANQEAADAAAGSYIVVFRDDSLAFHSGALAPMIEARVGHQILYDLLSRDQRIANFQFLTSINLMEPENSFQEQEFHSPQNLSLSWEQKNLGPSRGIIARVDFKDVNEQGAILSQWAETGVALFAEPNYVSTLSGDWATYQQNYDSAGISWHKAVNLSGAFAHLDTIPSASEDQPIVAVMDSGVDAAHPLLKDQIWVNDSPGIFNCGSDDLHGCNTANPPVGALGAGNTNPFGTSSDGEACPAPDAGEACKRNCCHGTHVAGIVASKLESNAGGICPTCRIMILRIVGTSADRSGGVILDSSIIGGLKYFSNFVRSSGKASAARVLTASFGKFQRSRAVSVLVRAIKDTPRRNRGVLIVAAAGNEDASKYQYPAAYSEAIAVANVFDNGKKASTSNYGRWVDIAAPGQNILSPIPGASNTISLQGTSMAAPVVAGIAGLIVATNPEISVEELRDRLIKGANPAIYESEVNQPYLARVPGESFSIPLLGSGMVDAANAVNGTETQNRPALLALDRVTSGCGHIALKDLPGISIYMLLILTAPLTLACLSFVKK